MSKEDKRSPDVRALAEASEAKAKAAAEREAKATAAAAAAKIKLATEALKERQVEAAAGKKALEGKTNQDMINVLYKAAEKLGIEDGWALLKWAGLTDLVDDRKAAYSGPMVADFPEKITDAQKAVISEVLASYVRPK